VQAIFIEAMFSIPITAHILGGAAIGRSVALGREHVAQASGRAKRPT
jgi:hypothetical protein